MEIQENFLFFKNYTGIFDTDNKIYLIIPKKLAKHFNLINDDDRPIENLKEKYGEQFEGFLKYILTGLSKEKIIYNLSLPNFPVEESSLNKSRIFRLLLLLNKKEEIIGSFYLILSNPHKKMIKYEIYKNIDGVNYIDPNVVLDIIQNIERLCEAQKGAIAYQKKRYSPLTVLQYKTKETFDVMKLDNRKKLILQILTQILKKQMPGLKKLK